MRSAVRSAAGIGHNATAGTCTSPPLPLPGLLSEAPPEVRASPEDALGGSWNMSDLPPWLRIPSFVNTAECLHPMQRSALPSGAPPPAPGDALYEEPRSVLILGPSHQRDMFHHMCHQLLGSARRGNASMDDNAHERCRKMHVTGFNAQILRRHVYGG